MRAAAWPSMRAAWLIVVCTSGVAGTSSDQRENKQLLKSYGITARWAPSHFQLGDCLTKATTESCDTLRGFLSCGYYQLHDEKDAMRVRAEQREMRQAYKFPLWHVRSDSPVFGIKADRCVCL